MQITLKQIFQGIFEILKTLAIVFIIAFLIKTYLVQTFIVDGQSMETNFHNGEYLLVDKLSYRLSTPKRGDVIVFIPPDDMTKDYIKRVIGLPGDFVKVTADAVYINNKQIDEQYLSSHTNSNNGQNDTYTIKLGQDQYFVMGDNRLNSKDSRSIGPIHRNDIIGRTFIVVFPFYDFGLVHHQSYSIVAASN